MHHLRNLVLMNAILDSIVEKLFLEAQGEHHEELNRLFTKPLVSVADEVGQLGVKRNERINALEDIFSRHQIGRAHV